jgi:hypothetical protein
LPWHADTRRSIDFFRPANLSQSDVEQWKKHVHKPAGLHPPGSSKTFSFRHRQDFSYVIYASKKTPAKVHAFCTIPLGTRTRFIHLPETET